MLIWTTWSVPGLTSGLVALVLAIAIVRAASAGRVNRQLALLLLVEGSYISLVMGVMFITETRSLARVISILGMVMWVMVPFRYLRFLGSALDTPSVAPLRRRSVVIALEILAVTGAVLIVAFPESFMTEPYDPGWAPWNFRARGYGHHVNQLNGVVSVFALVAALSSYRRAPRGTGARARAKWVALAFGVRDAYTATTLIFYPVLRPMTFWGDVIYNPGYALTHLVFAMLLSYGVLRTHVFDIDLRIRLALERSTVITAIAAAFFIGSELLERVVPVEGTVLGLLLAGAIVGALWPVQRLVARAVEDRLPEGRAEPEPEVSKGVAYGAAFEAAIGDGVLTWGEREALRRLRWRLALSDREAMDIERVVGRPVDSVVGPEGARRGC